MPTIRRANKKLLARLAKVEQELAQLERDLNAHGDGDLADVAKRAHREFMHPNYTGALNTLDMEHDPRAVL